jgi:hypothetical protein
MLSLHMLNCKRYMDFVLDCIFCAIMLTSGLRRLWIKFQNIGASYLNKEYKTPPCSGIYKHSDINKYALSTEYGSTAQIWPWPPPLRFLNHTELDTYGRTPLSEWSARRRDLYLHRTTEHINTREKRMPWAGFEPAIPAIKRPQTYALDRAASGISTEYYKGDQIKDTEIDVACSTHEAMRNACEILYRKLEDNRPLERSWCRWNIANIKIYLKYDGLNWILRSRGQWWAILNEVINFLVP